MSEKDITVRSVLVEKKVYCRGCRHFYTHGLVPGCEFDGNLVYTDTPYDRQKIFGDCSMLNKNNDCKNFEKKIDEEIPEDTTTGTSVEILSKEKKTDERRINKSRFRPDTSEILNPLYMKPWIKVMCIAVLVFGFFALVLLPIIVYIGK